MSGCVCAERARPRRREGRPPGLLPGMTLPAGDAEIRPLVAVSPHRPARHSSSPGRCAAAAVAAVHRRRCHPFAGPAAAVRGAWKYGLETQTWRRRRGRFYLEISPDYGDVVLSYPYLAILADSRDDLPINKRAQKKYAGRTTVRSR